LNTIDNLPGIALGCRDQIPAMILFINGFVPLDWAQHEVTVRNRHCYTGAALSAVRSRTMGAVKTGVCVVEMFDPNKKGNVYSPSRDITWGQPDSTTRAANYWDSVKTIFEQGFGDYRSFFINGSFDNPSMARDRYAAGMRKGQQIIAKWLQGEAAYRQSFQNLRAREQRQRVCLDSSLLDQQFYLRKNEKLRIVAHSMGAAYAAGLATVLSRHTKYAAVIDVIFYLAPHQPADIVHPPALRAYQSSSAEDIIASRNEYHTNIDIPVIRNLNRVEIPTSALKGQTSYALIRNVPASNFIQNRTHEPDMLRGHSVGTYDDEIKTFFSRYRRMP
jgi:hypothetical protein